MHSRDIGALGEKIAAEYLTGLGYVILERNFRSREGEIDIIAHKDDFLVFIEVRTRTSTSYGTPEESPLDRVTLSQAKQYLSEGHFPPGSMGPKIEGAVKFLERGGHRGLVAAIPDVQKAMHGEAGTEIVPD